MKILGISGSLRRNSYNTWLLQAASELIDIDPWVFFVGVGKIF